jgi:hypothetical protein
MICRCRSQKTNDHTTAGSNRAGGRMTNIQDERDRLVHLVMATRSLPDLLVIYKVALEAVLEETNEAIVQHERVTRRERARLARREREGEGPPPNDAT